MTTSLRGALLLLIFVVILFLIGVIVWLFYCNCGPFLGAKPPFDQRTSSAATVPPNRATGNQYPHFDVPKEEFNEDRGHAVPTGRLRGSLAPTRPGSQLFQIQKNKQNPPLGGAGDPVVFTNYNGLGTSAGSVGTPPDVNAARNGNVVMLSYNTSVLLSIDGTGSYKLLDPTTIFPSGPSKDAAGNFLDNGLCCDQKLLYVPQIDRFIWLMQFCGTGPGGCLNGINRVRIAAASTQDVINSNGTSWTYWDLLSSTFNLGTTTMDYPDLSLGDNYLYFSLDSVSQGLLVVRIPLTEIRDALTINMNYTTPSDSSLAYGGHISQNTGNAVYWAGHVDSSTIRIFSFPGIVLANIPGAMSPSAVGQMERFLPTPPMETTGCNSLAVSSRKPQCWALRAVQTTKSGFAWTGSSNSNFKNAQVQVLELNISDYSVISQWQIWNDAYAFAYPSLATNSNGEVGISLAACGDNPFYGNNAVGILGDFIVWYPELSDADVAARFGDYFNVARNTPNSLLFDASGYAVLEEYTPSHWHAFRPLLHSVTVTPSSMVVPPGLQDKYAWTVDVRSTRRHVDPACPAPLPFVEQVCC